MKKLLCIILTLMLMPVFPAMAAEDLSQYAIANAAVQAAGYVDITAPYSGTLTVFDLAPGDSVNAGAVLMTMQTTGVYAPEDGTVGAVFAGPGDDASALSQRYGGILGIEPAALYQMECTTSGAYDRDENRTLHLGETLYFRIDKDDEDEGVVRVVMVTPEGYRVDILSGEFELGERFTLYRDDNFKSRDCVGKGTVTRRADVMLASAGRVAEILVKEGDQVTSGQLVATLMGPDAAPDASPVITAAEGGVISSVMVVPGQQVWKGQVLCRIELTESIEVVAEVDEMDLGSLCVGDKVPVTVDMLGDRTISGTVTEISALGVTRQNAAYYTVRVSIPKDSAPLGASASVYLPKK